MEKEPETADSLLPKSSRKRRLSEAPKLQAIPEASEESFQVASPRKYRKKSVSASAVPQKIEETPSKRRGRPPKNDKSITQSK